MTALTRTTSPHRADALRYLRSGRVVVGFARIDEPGSWRPDRVQAVIEPAPDDRSGSSVRVYIRAAGGIWDCTEHRGANDCAHRLAVQTATGWGELEGRWAA